MNVAKKSSSTTDGVAISLGLLTSREPAEKRSNPPVRFSTPYLVKTRNAVFNLPTHEHLHDSEDSRLPAHKGSARSILEQAAQADSGFKGFEKPQTRYGEDVLFDGIRVWGSDPSSENIPSTTSKSTHSAPQDGLKNNQQATEAATKPIISQSNSFMNYRAPECSDDSEDLGEETDSDARSAPSPVFKDTYPSPIVQSAAETPSSPRNPEVIHSSPEEENAYVLVGSERRRVKLSEYLRQMHDSSSLLRMTQNKTPVQSETTEVAEELDQSSPESQEHDNGSSDDDLLEAFLLGVQSASDAGTTSAVELFKKLEDKEFRHSVWSNLDGEEGAKIVEPMNTPKAAMVEPKGPEENSLNALQTRFQKLGWAWLSIHDALKDLKSSPQSEAHDLTTIDREVSQMSDLIFASFEVAHGTKQLEPEDHFENKTTDLEAKLLPLLATLRKLQQAKAEDEAVIEALNKQVEGQQKN